jgi:hypothetical protein
MVGPPEELPASIGVPNSSLPKINNTTLRTNGWELIIAWNDQIKDFGYSVSFNLSDYTSKVIKFPNPSKSLSTYYEGETLGEIWGYETEGIAKTNDQMTTWLQTHDQTKLGSQWQAGDIMYRDLNNDKKIDNGQNTVNNPGDMRIIGNSTPRYRFGFNFSCDWKGIDCRIFLQGVAKRDIWLSGPEFWGGNGGEWQSMGLVEHLNSFRTSDSPLGENLNSYYPRFYLANGGKNQNVQTKYLQNAAYLRLKNVQLGYTFSTKLIKKIGLQKLRIYSSADNILTLTHLSSIFDPEANQGLYGDGKIYPLQATVSFGLNVTF